MKPDDKQNVTVQLDPELLVKVDSRAEALDLNRSQYFRRLVKKDLGIPFENVTTEPEEVHA